ncbi:hypothetical protein HD554DRAFT_751388 [Boletus coccyginus]|nr:hypothetical protein HD554DRAFT_751388 [Boletus coccyginus]
MFRVNRPGTLTTLKKWCTTRNRRTVVASSLETRQILWIRMLLVRRPSSPKDKRSVSLTTSYPYYLQLTSARLDELRGQLGLPLPDIDGLTGLKCTPILVFGTGSGVKCTQKPVCYPDNDFIFLCKVERGDQPQLRSPRPHCLKEGTLCGALIMRESRGP